ncbi:beta-lactamase family protein [Skermania sp. ID1734]|nr:beta-lactamase family protein [Skermania sp. ID1734]
MPPLPRPPLLPDPLRRATVPDDLESVTDYGNEVTPSAVGMTSDSIEHIWNGVRDIYRGGAHPAIQLCVRRYGRVVLNRSIGYAHGNGPGDGPGTEKTLATTETPFCVYSASKAITATVAHLLDERGLLHIGDRVSDYIPEFGRNGKKTITIAQVLSHRAGIPNHPSEVTDLAFINDREAILEALCNSRPIMRPGKLQAYHALTGGAIIAELTERVTGRGIRDVLQTEILDPLDFRWTNYGVAPRDVSKVATNYLTGLPSPPPVSTALNRLLGVTPREAVDISNDPRFLTGVVPAGNVVTTALELSRFFEMLRREGELDGVRILQPRTVHRAISEQSFLEVDFALGLPIRYSYGFMLGGKYLSLFGPHAEHAFGHLGFTNVVGYADPDRGLAVGLLTSGKPVLYPEVFNWLGLMGRIGSAAGMARQDQT